MPRIAILGSCITRDVWRFRGAAVTEPTRDLLYISRTSLPSLFATPVAGFRPDGQPPAGLRPQQHRALVSDLRKSALAELVAFRPTHLIFDFIDERYDLLSVGGALAVNSWELAASGYLGQPAFQGARIIPRLSAGCERLWLEAAGEFAAFVRATPLAGATLILHSAQWAGRQRLDGGRTAPVTGMQILEGQPADVAAHNALLARYEAAFTEVMPPMARVAAPSLRVADPSHQWGLSPFHYASDYYREIWAQLGRLGVDAPAAP